MFYVDIRHEGLNKFRRVTGANQYVVEQRAQAQRDAWNEQWAKKCEVEKKRRDQQQLAFSIDGKKEKAVRQTEVAQEQIAQFGNILAAVFEEGTAFSCEVLYTRAAFAEVLPVAPAREQAPTKPNRSDAIFAVRRSFLSWFIGSIRQREEDAARLKFESAEAEWRAQVDDINKKNEKLQAKFQAQLSAWNRKKAEFETNQKNNNAKIDEFLARYAQRDRNAVTEYFDSVLSQSEYPDCFPKQWQIDFIAETGVFVIDYELPSLESFPTLKAVKYVQTRDAFDQQFLKENEVSQLFDVAMYQTCLRTLHELFSSDTADALKSVTFNGWVNFVDKANGKPARSCIMSVQATKAVFQELNLRAVDPKACFRALKGVGSAKLAGMAAVVPILRLNKFDERFVPAHDVIESIAEATNIAAIPWEEFEYLVRDIFEKEFSANGGEVKITRASRDHGVDAIAFDPDPIRGGKIVIQAKRYTSVVGVSAVRDLYGTLINEGANRGILVTTSQYGADSYDFAKDKPITLLDGGNLLSLLDRHGHKARIDLVEAKKLGTAREQR
jgi:restriction system protein